MRPQLPSLFEPAPATREIWSEPEFERENFVEPLPVIEASEKLAPLPLSIPTPRQSVLHEPAQTVSSRAITTGIEPERTGSRGGTITMS